MPNGDRSVATVPSAPGVVSGKSPSSHASYAALPSAAAVSPYTRGDGDSSKAEKYSREAQAATAASRRSR